MGKEWNLLEIKRDDFRTSLMNVRSLLLDAGFDLSGVKSIEKEVDGDVIKYKQEA